MASTRASKRGSAGSHQVSDFEVKQLKMKVVQDVYYSPSLSDGLYDIKDNGKIHFYLL